MHFSYLCLSQGENELARIGTVLRTLFSVDVKIDRVELIGRVALVPGYRIYEA